jgi:telomere length regulation protein
MDELLTPISTTYLKPKKEELLFTEHKSTNKVHVESAPVTRVGSVDEALNVLKGQPDYSALIAVLHFLTRSKPGEGSFSLHTPSPKSAAIIHLLVTEIAPNYWTLLLEGSSEPSVESNLTPAHDAELFLQCLRSVTGLNAVVAFIKSLNQESKGSQSSRRPDLPLVRSMFLDILAEVLRGDATIHNLWDVSTGAMSNPALQKTQSHSLVSILAGGRLVSVVAEAASGMPKDQLRTESRWITDTLEYTKWVGRNLASCVTTSVSDLELHFCQELLRQAMSLGYPGTLFSPKIYVPR